MIGIFGGTFDPVHFGHLRSALEVKDIFGLDEVRLIPCAMPPHRESPAVTAAMRLQMLALAIKNQPGLKIDTRELERYERQQTPSYMVDTLESLRQEFPHETLLLFIGTDAFKYLTGWHQWQRLFDYAHIVVLTRPGFAIQQLIAKDGVYAASPPGADAAIAKDGVYAASPPGAGAADDFFKLRLAGDITELAQATAGKLYFQQITQLDISATAIRHIIAQKQNPGFLLPDAVIEYIKQHQLYGTH
ncbi:MAG: nicotinate-nucleotide adenylyltransferase [Methylobacter sp.]|nr:nicotinate-nucleotide adenylyltransferase [Methylobacter sp.]